MPTTTTTTAPTGPRVASRRTPPAASLPSTCLEHYDAFERRVLPALFERLDRAFPEFAWTRTPHGWRGRVEQEGRPQQVECYQPWGFIGPDGRMVSWISYLNRGAAGSGDWDDADRLLVAIDRLAERAGLPEARFAKYLDRGERATIARRARQRELLEAFAAHTEWLLRQGVGRDARQYLNRAHGIDGERLAGLPLGLYTEERYICDELIAQGFSEDELTAARVMRDDRLTGRAIVAWRDRFGRIQTIVAQQIHHEAGGTGRTLYWKQGVTREPFGIDAAIRTPDCRQWMAVEGLFEALYLRQQGLEGVVSFGHAGKLPTAAQWELLAELDVEQVTLAFATDAPGIQRTLDAIEASCLARRTPQLFALPPDAWGASHTAATYARLQGLGHVRGVLERRWHAYHYLVERIIARHRPRPEWTDAGLVAAVNEAVECDARIFRPERALELGRFFWPTILEATGADWNVLRDMLRRRGEKKRRLSPDLKTKGPYHKLVYEMRAALQDHDLQRCEELIRAAARSLGVEVEQLRREINAGRPQAWMHVTPNETTTYQVEPPPATLSTQAVPRPKPVQPQPVKPRPEPVVEQTRGMNIDWLNRVLAASAVAPEQPPIGAPPATLRYYDDEPPVQEEPLDLSLAAYLLWEKKGRPAGKEQECWLEAERALRRA